MACPHCGRSPRQDQAATRLYTEADIRCLLRDFAKEERCAARQYPAHAATGNAIAKALDEYASLQNMPAAIDLAISRHLNPDTPI